ncbi:MAG: response regulator, partial [Gorillibacterium sp.]|nr:response regulator [Gorillibacterium sp.]
MYKALIVEDEFDIRQGMLNHSIWRELGIEFVYEADDGFSAMEVIKQMPDIRIVITDIKMKRMSGMEFIQKLREELSFSGKVIIISGYDDFQYARNAMIHGVVDYLLKPVNMAELKQVMIKSISELEREEQQQY